MRCGASPPLPAGESAALQREDADGDSGEVRATASDYTPEVFETDARKWALQIHAAEGRSSDSTLAMFPPEEVEGWAVDWLVTMQARGWKLDGAPVANPRAAIRGYLRKAAVGRSKRFREVSPGEGEAVDFEP